MLALAHAPSPYMDQGQRTHVERVPIDYSLAVRQHAEYCRELQRLGAAVRILDANRDLPDSVFIEDTAVVLDEVALLASMGTKARRAELPGIEKELRKYREVHILEPPATVEGGDVLRVGRTLFVGLSSRTNAAGVDLLAATVKRYGYEVVPVPVHGCLHLKTACTALPDRTLLVNPDWIDVQALQGFEMLQVPTEEPWGANSISLNGHVLMAANHSQTAELIQARGLPVHQIDLSEFAKAEGGVTCLSILLKENRRHS
jgi:dimethylargininase